MERASPRLAVTCRQHRKHFNLDGAVHVSSRHVARTSTASLDVELLSLGRKRTIPGTACAFGRDFHHSMSCRGVGLKACALALNDVIRVHVLRASRRREFLGGGGSLKSAPSSTVDSSHGPSPRHHIMSVAICSLPVSSQRTGSSPGHKTKSGDSLEAQALPRDSRRKACLSLAAFSAWALAAKRATAVQSPYEVTTAEVGLVKDRLRGCPATFNCVSSAARSSDQYESPWIAPEPSLSAAAELLVAAVTAVSSAAVVVTSEATADGYYVRIQAPGKFDQPDELEFMLLPEGKDAALVTLRSCAGGVKCACICVPSARH
jgi:uncharacterized protein (DUF1499 family)